MSKKYFCNILVDISHQFFQGNSPIWSLCEAGDALVTGGESGAVVRTACGKKEAIKVDTTLVETR